MLRESILLKLNDLRGYITTVNDALTREFHEFDDWVAKQTGDVDPATADDFREFCSDTAWELADQFPTMARHSSFVSTYSLLERQLIAICKCQRREQDIDLKVDDLRDKGIFAAQVYLKKVCEIDFPDQNKEWREITVYNKIRNFIVHNDAQIHKPKPRDPEVAIEFSDNAKTIKDYADKNASIEIDKNGYIMLSQKFCEESIDTIEAFFDLLLAPR